MRNIFSWMRKTFQGQARGSKKPKIKKLCVVTDVRAIKTSYNVKMTLNISK
jgi:hypothetical protein